MESFLVSTLPEILIAIIIVFLITACGMTVWQQEGALPTPVSTTSGPIDTARPGEGNGGTFAPTPVPTTSSPIDTPTLAPRSTPTHTLTNTPTPTSLSIVLQSDSASEDQVIITVSQNRYQPGEEVRFTIANNSEKTIYFTYGCSWPVIFKIEEDEALIPITVNILESVPDATQLLPEEIISCFWDQQAWQNPEEEDNARFQDYIELAPVPPGQYQFRLDYYFDETEIYSFDRAETTRSQTFSIE